MTELHPGVTAEQASRRTGWPLAARRRARGHAAPDAKELAALRALQAA